MGRLTGWILFCLTVKTAVSMAWPLTNTLNTAEITNCFACAGTDSLRSIDVLLDGTGAKNEHMILTDYLSSLLEDIYLRNAHNQDILHRFWFWMTRGGTTAEDRINEKTFLNTGLGRFWRCLNVLAASGYTVRPFVARDIELFHALGGPRQTLEMLADIIISHDRIADTALPLSLLKYGLHYMQAPDRYLLFLMRRLIPTMMTLRMNNMDSTYSLAKYGLSSFEKPYYLVHNESDLQSKSYKLVGPLKSGLLAIKDRIPRNEFQQVIRQLLELAFQADNEIMIEFLLSNILKINDQRQICQEVAAIKERAFNTRPLRDFPRIISWYSTVANSSCAPLHDPMQFSDLPNDMIEFVLDQLDNIKDIERVRGVNKLMHGLSKPLATSQCNSLHAYLSINRTAKTAQFIPNFLFLYMTTTPHVINFEEQQTWTHQKLSEFWNCAKALANAGYTVSGFDDHNLLPFMRLRQSVRALVQIMVDDDTLVDTTIPLFMIRYGHLPPFIELALLIQKLMPTFQPLPTRYIVKTDKDMVRRSNDLFHAIQNLLSLNNTASTFGTLVAIISAFSADNAHILKLLLDPHHLHQVQEVLRRPVYGWFSQPDEIYNEVLLEPLMGVPLREKLLFLKESLYGDFDWHDFPNIKIWFDELN